MKQLGTYENATMSNLLMNEFMKGRNKNLSEEEELIVDHEDDPLSYEVKGGSYNCQICNHKLGSRTGLRDHIR